MPDGKRQVFFLGGANMEQRGSYRDLQIYQLAHSLGVEVHRFSFQLPKHELYETGGQLRRASKSISANIVEGYGRRFYKADFIRFLIYAQASCDETTEWLRYLLDCYEALGHETQALLDRSEELGRKINRFTQSVVAAHRSPK